MGGNLYMMDAARMLTAGAVDLGEKPAVVSAIAKYHITERGARRSSTTRWTSSAARASAWARRTSSARAYMQMPVGDHRRGRQHPDAQPDHLRPGRDPLPSVRAEGDRRRRARRDRRSASVAFDAALFGHVGFTLSNVARALVTGLTGSHFVRVPATSRRRRAATTSSSRASRPRSRSSPTCRWARWAAR